MKKFIVKIVALLCAFAICVPLAACGGGKDNGPKTTGELTFDENNKVVFRDVSVKLTHVVAGDDKVALQALVERFNAEYIGQISVNLNMIDQGSYEASVGKQISNKTNAPDLLMFHQKSHKNFADNNLIQPFDEAIEKSGITIDLSEYADGLAQYSSCGYDGKLYSVPVDAQSYSVIYNKQLIAEYNDGKLPASNAELIEVCEKFKAETQESAIAWSTTDGFFQRYLFYTALLQNGAHLYDESNDCKADWYDSADNKNAFVKAVKSIRQLNDSGYAKLDEAATSNLSRFFQNRAIFLVYFPWLLNNVIKGYANSNGLSDVEAVQNEKLGAVSMANWFALDENSATGSLIYGDSHFFAMSKTVEDINVKAATLEFIKWYTQTTSTGVKWAEAGHVSAYKPLIETAEYKTNNIVSSYLLKYMPDINNFRVLGNTPYWDITINSLTDLFTDTVRAKSAMTDSDIGSKIKTAQDAANAQIDAMHIYG